MPAEVDVRASETQVLNILEIAPDAIIVIDESQRILLFNKTAEQMFAYRVDEVLGQPLDLLIPQRFVEAHRQHVLMFKDVPEMARRMGERQQLVGRRKDGSEFPAEISIAKSMWAGKTTFSAIVRDVTEQVEAYQLLERRVAERTRELATLLEISRTIAATLELEPLFDLILDQLKVMIDYSSASLFLLQGDTLVMVAYRGSMPLEQALQLRIPVDSDLRRILDQRAEQIIFADILGEEPAAWGFRPIIDKYLTKPNTDARAVVWIPLMVKQRMIGGLEVTHSEAGYFTERHAGLALTLANQAAIAIENAKLYEQAQEFATLQERQRLARELHDAVTQMLFSASLIAEVLPRIWEVDQHEGQAYLEDLRRLTRGTLAEMRALLLELRPSTLIETGLGDLLRQLADAIAGRTRLPVEVNVEETPSLPAEIKIALYRVAQEALNNIVKHARAGHVTISLRQIPHPGEAAGNGISIELLIRDDGRGFDPTCAFPEHFGLNIMRERAEAIGATLHVQSQPGQGTQVSLVWRNRSPEMALG